MARLGAVLLGTMLLAACAPPAPKQSAGSAEPLYGAWAYDDLRRAGAQSPPQGGCGTDFGVTYAADGTFSGYEEEGTWRVEGLYLIQATTKEPGDKGELAPVRSPKAVKARLDWISDNIVNVRGDVPGDGYALIRCADPTR